MATPRLFLVPNLLGIIEPSAVLPQRTIQTTRQLRHFAVETPKAARAFLATLKFDVPIAALQMVEMSDHATVDSWLGAGYDVGIVADAGCPATADPGAALVAHAHTKGVCVVPLVGPSALLLGLMASGMNGQRFKFHGYLDTAPAPRARTLKMMETDVVQSGTTHLFIETPYRNAAIIQAVRQSVQPSLAFCVAQNLTLPSQRIISKPIAEWTTGDAEALAGKYPSIFLLGIHQQR